MFPNIYSHISQLFEQSQTVFWLCDSICGGNTLRIECKYFFWRFQCLFHILAGLWLKDPTREAGSRGSQLPALFRWPTEALPRINQGLTLSASGLAWPSHTLACYGMFCPHSFWMSVFVFSWEMRCSSCYYNLCLCSCGSCAGREGSLTVDGEVGMCSFK